VGYLCANFSLPRPLFSRLRPSVRDRQTDVRHTSDAHHRLMPPGRGITTAYLESQTLICLFILQMETLSSLAPVKMVQGGFSGKGSLNINCNFHNLKRHDLMRQTSVDLFCVNGLRVKVFDIAARVSVSIFPVTCVVSLHTAVHYTV